MTTNKLMDFLPNFEPDILFYLVMLSSVADTFFDGYDAVE